MADATTPQLVNQAAEQGHSSEIPDAFYNSAQTIYGYYITDSGNTKVIYAEKFASAISLTNPSSLNVTPVVTLTL